MNTGAPVIAWRDLACRFGSRTVFCGFSGSLNEGDRLRVTAPSGYGKTSFLMMLLKLLSPAEGTIELDGKDYSELPLLKLRSAVAAVPQEAELADLPTVRDVIDETFGWKMNRSAKPSRDEILSILERMALPSTILDASPSSLSGGEKQRIACLIALLLPRRVLLLDEPFSALDTSAAKAVSDAFVMSDRAILYVTHVDITPSFSTGTIDLESCCHA